MKTRPRPTENSEKTFKYRRYIDMPISDDSSMVAVPIGQFLSISTVPVDVYVRLSENKFILVAKGGSKTQVDRLGTYQNKKVEHLYILKQDFERFTNQSVTIAGIIVDKQDLSQTAKTRVVSKAVGTVAMELENLNIDREAIAKATEVANTTARLVESTVDLSTLIQGLAYHSDALIAHSVAVSILGAMIARTMGWQKRHTLEKIALGGLLHDIGKKELPKDLLVKARAQMTFAEIQQYESHPFRGFQILQSLGNLPDDVLSIVYEHHENAIGQGFPRRLRDIRLNPLGKVIAVANSFAGLILTNANNPHPRSAQQAIDYIQNVTGQPFHKPTFNALKALVTGEKYNAA